MNYSESFADKALQQALSDIEVSVQNGIRESTLTRLMQCMRCGTFQRVLVDVIGAMAAMGVAAAMLAPTPGSIASASVELSCAGTGSKRPTTGFQREPSWYTSAQIHRSADSRVLI